MGAVEAEGYLRRRNMEGAIKENESSPRKPRRAGVGGVKCICVWGGGVLESKTKSLEFMLRTKGSHGGL